MTKHIMNPDAATLGEFIGRHYPDYAIIGGAAAMDMDISHGCDVETYDNTAHGRGVSVTIYPYVKWTDGDYKPTHYNGAEFYIYLEG